jgi:hypothetical protein
MKSAKIALAFDKLTGVYAWDDATRSNLTTLLKGELRRVRALFSDEELKCMFDIQYTFRPPDIAPVKMSAFGSIGRGGDREVEAQTRTREEDGRAIQLVA